MLDTSETSGGQELILRGSDSARRILLHFRGRRGVAGRGRSKEWQPSMVFVGVLCLRLCNVVCESQQESFAGHDASGG